METKVLGESRLKLFKNAHTWRKLEKEDKVIVSEKVSDKKKQYVFSLKTWSTMSAGLRIAVAAAKLIFAIFLIFL